MSKQSEIVQSGLFVKKIPLHPAAAPPPRSGRWWTGEKRAIQAPSEFSPSPSTSRQNWSFIWLSLSRLHTVCVCDIVCVALPTCSLVDFFRFEKSVWAGGCVCTIETMPLNMWMCFRVTLTLNTSPILYSILYAISRNNLLWRASYLSHVNP